MTTKYSTIFEHVIRASDLIKPDLLNISEASQKELQDYVPYVDYSKSQDLLGMAFDVALVNVFNLNGDGICSKGAIKMAPTLTHKPINIEHDRSTIVGHILEGSFSDVDFKKRLYPSDVEDTLIPFNITLGGVLYKVVAKGLAEILKDIQEGKETDFMIASSWEVGFDSFFAAIGSNRLDQCRIITDQAEVEKLAPYMKGSGGKGVLPNGEIINRLIDPNGTIVFLGAGLTKYPAASVGPVHVFDYSELKDEPVAAQEKAISHLKEDDVSSMRTETIDMDKQEIIDTIKEAVASAGVSQEALASTTSKIADAIVESNKVFVAEKEAAIAEAAKAGLKVKEQDEKIASLEQKIAETVATLEKANEKLQKIEEEGLALAAKEKFNERMSALDEKFALTDADREIISKQVQAVASDEAFAELVKSFEVIMAPKLKETIAASEVEVAKKLEVAVAEELKKRGIKDPLEEAKTEKTELPNNSVEASKTNVSLREKFSQALDRKKIKVTI